MKKLLILLLSLQLTGLSGAWAADDEEDFVKTTQQDILLVAGAGAAGAILGLSTLSFVDQPSKHLANIWTGAAIGVIAGVIFVAYNSAQKGQEDLEGSIDYRTHERVAWHHQNLKNLTFSPGQIGTGIWAASF